MEVAEPALLARALAAARAGIPVIAIGELAKRAPGLVDAEARDAAVREGVAQLKKVAVRVDSERQLAQALLELELDGPLVAADAAPLRFSVEHRVTADGHILLVFNESWSTTRQKLLLKVGDGPIVRWDPGTGQRAEIASNRAEPRSFELVLEPAASIVLTTGL